MNKKIKGISIIEAHGTTYFKVDKKGGSNISKIEVDKKSHSTYNVYNEYGDLKFKIENCPVVVEYED